MLRFTKSLMNAFSEADRFFAKAFISSSFGGEVGHRQARQSYKLTNVREAFCGFDSRPLRIKNLNF
jgi:hypothetical protein